MLLDRSPLVFQGRHVILSPEAIDQTTQTVLPFQNDSRIFCIEPIQPDACFLKLKFTHTQSSIPFRL
ncbi:MAG: hypothetical protein CL925_10715 [Deltaproteobacteria bacterium]|jgi:hypothetical protein|nr:hypothetical protein [Deltaproteobacteria bacterium]MBP44863.1 hypothetical protein [Deltaproteobacteria bacterium]